VQLGRVVEEPSEVIGELPQHVPRLSGEQQTSSSSPASSLLSRPLLRCLTAIDWCDRGDRVPLIHLGQGDPASSSTSPLHSRLLRP
jgi:hypothetical protein